MPVARPTILLLLCALVAHTTFAADQAEREALRYNDAVTKLQQARDEVIANLKAKTVNALVLMAKSRTKAEDTAGAAEAWRAVLTVDREQADARAYFTASGTLEQVLAELKAKPTDLLGLDSGDAPAKAEKGTTEKAP